MEYSKNKIDKTNNNNEYSHSSGTSTAISRATEILIVTALQLFTGWGYGLTKFQVVSLVNLERIKQTFLFKNDRPGKDWFHGFMNRWSKEISVRKAYNSASSRYGSCIAEIMNFFVTKQYQFTEFCNWYLILFKKWNLFRKLNLSIKITIYYYF